MSSMSDGLRSLADIIGRGLADLEQRSDEATRLASRVRAALQGDARDHVISASRQGDALIVLMDSAAWCPQVRYQQEQLKATLAAAGESQIAKVKVRVGAPAGS
jgi:hypothetical protein